ncbi:MAG: hypothetical protein KF819_33985 [Labilithrix sp.]|nr:hypothetical protein [Labilithrix sp.]
MLALPHLSGSELVATLSRLGFRIDSRAAGLATMVRDVDGDDGKVVVPETATLSPALVAALLRAAAVDPFEFLDGLDRTRPTAPAMA